MVRTFTIEITNGSQNLQLITEQKVRVIGRNYSRKGNKIALAWYGDAEWRICGGTAE